MIPLLLGLLLSFFGCYGADASKALAGDVSVVFLSEADRAVYEDFKLQQATALAREAAQAGKKSADERLQTISFAEAARRLNQKGSSEQDSEIAPALVVTAQPVREVNLDDVVTEQPRPQPDYVFAGGAKTVNTYKGLPYSVCAPLVIKNGRAGCPVRFCCACNTCGLPRVVVAGCLVTNNTAENLPVVEGGLYDQAGHLGQLAGRKETLNFAPDSVGKLVCICGGCCVTVNQDNK